MRKLLFPALVLMTFNVFGQATPGAAPAAPATPPANPYGQMDNRPDFIVAVQIATDTLKDGEARVKLSEATIMEMKEAMASPDYVVTLTPRGHCGSLNLIETNEKGFVVRENGTKTSGGTFDYVVFAKQKRPMMPMRRPPMHPPTPAAGQQPAPPAQQPK